MTRPAKSPLAIIFLTIFIDMVGFGIVIPVLPLYAEGSRFGATELQLGALVGIYSLCQLIASPLFGKVSDRIGRKPVLLFSVICTAIGFAIMGAAQTLWMLFLARIIDGASGGNISTAQACIADVTPPEERSKAMGLIGAAFGLGFIIGPALGGILSTKVSLAAPFYFAAGLALLNALFIAVRLPETHGPEHRLQKHERASLGEVFAGGRAALIGMILAAYLASIAGFSMMTTLFALFNEKRFRYDAAHTGYLLAYVGLVGVFVQGGLIRRLLKRPVEKQLAIAGSAILAVSLYFLPLTSSLGSLLLVCAGIALGNGFVTPTLNGLASRHADRRAQGRTLGLMQSAGSLGRFAGPLLATWLLQFDPSGAYARTPFWTSAAILLLAMALILGVHEPKESTSSGAAVSGA